jgi:5'-phosphate synthase pdxT subunit
VKIGVLALQGDFDMHRKTLDRIGVASVEVRMPRQLDEVAGLIMPGGESTTLLKLMDAWDFVPAIEKFNAAGKPIFGTCAGMILLATEVLDGRDDQRSFGAIDLAVRRNAFGRQRDSFEADLDVDGIDGTFHAVFIRAPFVERTGAGVDVLAEVDGHPVLCRSGPVLVSSFHPELGHDRRLHRLFLEGVP